MNSMTRTISLRVFLLCLIVCASMVLIAIWVGKDDAFGEAYFKTTATLFIVGFASFLIWFSMTLLEIRMLLRKE
jgi:hypothetical protein